MSYRIIKNLPLGFQINRVIIVLFLISASPHVSGCAIKSSVQPNDESLKTRINQFYRYSQDGSFDKCWDMIEENSRGDKKEYVDFARRYSLQIISFSIASIEMDGANAKAEIIMTLLENNANSVSKTVDCWVYKEGDWRIKSAGRPLDWACK
jgi:hypothetical protein